MRKQRNIARLLILTLASAGLMSGLTSMPAGLVSAQAVASSWSYTGGLNTAGYHTATLLLNSKVLIAGPCSSAQTAPAPRGSPTST